MPALMPLGVKLDGGELMGGDDGGGAGAGVGAASLLLGSAVGEGSVEVDSAEDCALAVLTWPSSSPVLYGCGTLGYGITHRFHSGASDRCRALNGRAGGDDSLVLVRADICECFICTALRVAALASEFLECMFALVVLAGTADLACRHSAHRKSTVRRTAITGCAVRSSCRGGSE